jgi:hypothetical protein
MAKQVVDADGEIGVRRHQPGRRDDAMAVVVGIAGKRDVETPFHVEERCIA